MTKNKNIALLALIVVVAIGFSYQFIFRYEYFFQPLSEYSPIAPLVVRVDKLTNTYRFIPNQNQHFFPKPK